METSHSTFNPLFLRENSDPREFEDSSVNTSIASTLLCPTCCLNQAESSFVCVHVNSRSSAAKTCEELLTKLHASFHLVSMENVVLKSENEALRKAFNSKCEAVDILKSSTSRPFDVDQTCWNAFHENLALKLEIAKAKTDLAIVQGSLTANRNAYEARLKGLCDTIVQLKRRLKKLQVRLKSSVDENAYLTGKCQNLTGEHKPLGFINSPPVNVKISLAPKDSSLSDFVDFPSSPSARESLSRYGRPAASAADVTIAQPKQEGLVNEIPPSSSAPVPNAQSSHVVSPTESHYPPQPVHLDSLLSRIDAKYTNCSCLPAEQSLCDCALASIIVQRSLLKCSHQLSTEKRRVRDLKITINAYKIALKGEFGRNQNMVEAFSSVLSGIRADVSSVIPPSPSPVAVGKSSRLADSTVSPEKQPSNPSVALNQLLLWFHHTMMQLVQRMRKLSTSSGSTKILEDSTSLCADSSWRINSGRLKTLSSALDSPRARHSIDFSLLSDITPKPPVSFARRLTSRGSQRQIERLREARPVVEENFWSDANSTPDSSSSSRTMSPLRQLRKKKMGTCAYNYGDGARLLARVRSMDLSACHTEETTAFDHESNLQLLSRVLPKLNELYEIVTKQGIVWQLSIRNQAT